MPARCIGESRLAAHPETYIAPNHGYFAHDLIRFPAVTVDWHIVGQFRHSFLGQESCDQNVRVRKIHLADSQVSQQRTNFETPTLLVIHQGGKDGWRVEVRVGEEIDRAVHSNEPD